MDTIQAKSIPIINYLQSKGFYPVRKEKIKDEYVFCAPYRTDKDASLFVNSVKNVWKDFGSGKGGSIIDLVIEMENVNVAEALKILEKLPSESKINFSTFRQQKDFDNLFKISHIQPLRYIALLQYIDSRKVSRKIAAHYCKEVYYYVDKKKYFGISFENNKKGCEIRNKYFKGASSPKWFTIVPGTAKTKDQLNIFEGFFDFLSALTYYKTYVFKSDTIILNSLAFLKEIEKIIQEYGQLNCFLDNDNAGREANYNLKRAHKKTIDYSKQLYPDYKDFNEFLTNKK